jgi:capsular polysaccharide biosynthesis protein
MDIREFAAILLRKWWLILGMPLIVFAGMVWRSSDPPYESSFRASILMPGDTEVPGSSERPELMVLDDLPELIQSQVFAEDVASALPAVGGPNLSVDDVHNSLSSDRYSRILTVHATNDSASTAESIAMAVANVLPDAVNQNLVAVGAAPATVNIIDPPSVATPANEHRWLIIGLETLVALGFAIGIVLAMHGLRSHHDIEPAPDSQNDVAM